VKRAYSRVTWRLLALWAGAVCSIVAGCLGSTDPSEGAALAQNQPVITGSPLGDGYTAVVGGNAEIGAELGTWLDPNSRSLTRAEQLIAYIAEHSRSHPARILAVRKDGQLRAAASVTLEPHPDDDWLNIVAIVTHPAHRGEGAGRALGFLIALEARRLGVHTRTGPERTPEVVGFYESLHFVDLPSLWMVQSVENRDKLISEWKEAHPCEFPRQP
jgi:GNAT superfamily N-acetyltransferase